MADNTLAGVIAIVAIVLIAAVFFWNNTAGVSVTANVAAEPAAEPADACNPGRYCVGSKAMIVRDDCSIAQAFCDEGCVRETGLCA